jgi:FdhD protein
VNASAPTRPVAVSRWTPAALEAREEFVATEEPLALRIGGHPLAVVMRTPGHDRELAAGFLVTEGLLRSRADLLDLVACRDGAAPEANVLDALLAPGVPLDWTRLQRHTFASSSCGICGKATIDALRLQCPPLVSTLAPRPAVLAGLPSLLRGAQPWFDATGGVHACALFSADGELRALREDVGRHNALDKLVGWAFLADLLPLSNTLLLVSGRVSFELMQKALFAGIPAVAAISAPTSLAVEFARATGQTLVGFLRDGRMTVYAGTLSS